MHCDTILRRGRFFACTVILCLCQFAHIASAQTSDLDQRLAKLNDPDRQVRRNAIGDLRIWSPDPKAIEPLIEAMGDPDPQVWQEAAWALGAIGEPAVGPLLETLNDPEPQFREGALLALSDVHTPEAFAAILGGLQDPDKNVRGWAIAALGRSRDPNAIGPLIALLSSNSKDNTVFDASRALATIGAPAVKPLADLLKSGNRQERTWAMEGLSRIDGPQAVDALIGALNDSDADIRARAALVLSGRRNQDPRAVEPLIRLLKDPDPKVRLRVVDPLGRFNDPRMIEPLAVALGDSDAGVRFAAAATLGKLGDARAMESLLDALKSSSPDMRARAATALGGYKDSRVVEALISALNDPSFPGRGEAAEALGRIKDARAVEPLIAAFNRDSSAGESTAGTVSTNGAKARAYGDLQFSLRYHREAEIGALAKIGDPRAIPSFLTASKDIYLEPAAIEGLGETRDPRAVAPLIELFRQPMAYFMQIDDALGKIGRPAVKPLIAELKSKDATMRKRAADALATIADHHAFKPLLLLIHDSDPEVRSSAAWALGRTKDPRAIKVLISLLKDSGPVPNSAANTLASFGPSAVKPLIACLKSPDPDIRRNAGQALGAMQDSRATSALTEALQHRDSEVIAGAYVFFVRRGYPNSEDSLIEALNVAGDRAMAWAFVQCENDLLVQAARSWPQRETRQERPIISGLKWGEVPL